MYIGLHVKYPLFLSGFKRTLIFLTDFRKILISNSTKLRPVDCEFLHADERTDRHEANSRFSQFWEGVLKTGIKDRASHWNWPTHFPADFSSTFYHNLISIVTTLLSGLWGIGIHFLAWDMFLLLSVASSPILDLQEPPNQRNARCEFELSPSI